MSTVVRDCKTVWNNCLKVVREHVNEKSYQTWFAPIKPVSLKDDVLTIQVPSQFFYEYLEEHFVYVLKKAITKELGPGGRLEYSIIVDRGNANTGSLSINLPTSKNNSRINGFHNQQQTNTDEPLPSPFRLKRFDREDFQSFLNPGYTFDNFIEGDCNRLARSAGLAVSNKPGLTSFNPLTIYGAVGLGKTHLAQAIGNMIQDNFPDLYVLYVTSEKFVNQFMEAVRHNSLQELGNYYMQVDVLVFEDIQFFAGKDRSQEMFFNIFNHLHQMQKQIIMTCDCPIKDLNGIQSRLLSRVKWGLNADLQQPDLETKMAIIQQKMEAEGIHISTEVTEYIAQNVETNIRDMEGVLITLIAQSSLNKKEIDLNLAKSTLSSIVEELSTEVGIDFIVKSVSNYFEISIEQMKSKTRKKEIVIPRQISIYLAKNYTNMSLKAIGHYFGGRDHSTVIHSIEAVENAMITDKSIKRAITELQKRMKLKSL